MSDAPTFSDLVEDHAADTIDATAERIETALRLTKTQRLVLHALIRDRVRALWRQEVRPLEPSRTAFTGERAEPAADRSAYLSKRVAVCDRLNEGGTYKTWEDFTVADHESRIRFLESLVRGNERTIADHRDAIERINATPGATCLKDVEKFLEGAA